jgi:transcriptional regulator with XRE-family HTH domain
MLITTQMTDQTILQELGERLTQVRIERNLTQAALAEQSGVAKRTIERLESGQAATQLSSFLRICRALGLLDRFEQLLPMTAPSPMAQLRQQGRKRQRASGNTAAPTPKQWTWAEPG